MNANIAVAVYVDPRGQKHDIRDLDVSKHFLMDLDNAPKFVAATFCNERVIAVHPV